MQSRLPESSADLVESSMLLRFDGVGFDLPHSAHIVVEERVHRTARLSHFPMSIPRGHRVRQGTHDQERNRNQSKGSQFRIRLKHESAHNHDLQHRHQPLLDTINQHPLDRWNVLRHRGHDITSWPVIEPTKRKRLQPFVKVTAQIKNDFLLKGIVELNPQRIEQMLGEIGTQRCQQERR